MTLVDYPYAEGDRLAERNTYFYTPVVGQPMIDALHRSRAQVLADLPDPAPPPPAEASAPALPAPGSDIVDTHDLLESLWASLSSGPSGAADQAWITLLVHKFETTKRLHAAYGPGFRAIDPAQHRDLALYLRTGEILAVSFAESGRLPQLNALLKLVDTLCAMRQGLNAGQRARLAGLIRREADLLATV